MTKILCSTRGGASSFPNQDRAIALAKEREAALCFLHVSNVDFLDKLPSTRTLNMEAQMEEVGEFISVQDVAVPENVEVLSNPEEMVAIISSSYVAEEEVEGEEIEELAETSDEPEVIEKGKKEDEEDF